MKKLIRMFLWITAGLIILAIVTLFWPRIYHAKALLENDAEVTLSISPMIGIHSDWDRKLTVSYKGKYIQRNIDPDSGWWRGSNLYQHISGAYIIHEGQVGCISFTLKPLAFISAEKDSCIKNKALVRHGENQNSLYYDDMIYLGHFYETGRDKEGMRVRFKDFRQSPEPELPDIL